MVLGFSEYLGLGEGLSEWAYKRVDWGVNIKSVWFNVVKKRVRLNLYYETIRTKFATLKFHGPFL